MKRALAEILWEAANKFLWAGGKSRKPYQDNESCFAAKSAAMRPDDEWVCGTQVAPMPFLLSLGCEYYGEPFNAFREGPERQGVRYMWLLLAMHVAEDEGIEIDA